MKKIVIIGGGFGGVRLARLLARHSQVTLVNDTPDFRYSPALYRAATGRRMASARLPLDWMLLDIPFINLKIDKAVSIDAAKRTLSLASGETIDYDYASFALGSVTTYFNISGLDENTYGIKSPDEIERLRMQLHETAISKKTETQNYVVIGAGPTGVELAASLMEYLNRIKSAHRTGKYGVKVWLVDSSPRVLPAMSERASKLAAKHLESIGVEILLNTKVDSKTSRSIHTDNGLIKTHTVVWTAGTINNPFFKQHPDVFNLTEKGLVAINDRLQVRPSIYVLGDNAAAPYSGLAFSAIMNANFVAKDIRRRIQNKPRRNYRGVRPIQIVPTGEKSAVLQYGKITIGGRIASLFRSVADYIGYADVIGFTRAIDIWRAREYAEEACSLCALKRR